MTIIVCPVTWTVRNSHEHKCVLDKGHRYVHVCQCGAIR